MEVRVLFRMAGLCALHPPGLPRACGAVAPATPSGGSSSRHARSLVASPSITSWVAGRGREHDEVKQMSWSSGKAKKEVGNLSDKCRQAKLASATGRRLSVILPLPQTSVTLHRKKNLALVQPVHERTVDEKNGAFTEGLYCTRHWTRGCGGWCAVTAVYNKQRCPEGLGSRMR